MSLLRRVVMTACPEGVLLRRQYQIWGEVWVHDGAAIVPDLMTLPVESGAPWVNEFLARMQGASTGAKHD